MSEQHDTVAERPLKRSRGRPRVDPAAREVVPVDGTKLNGTGRKVLSLHLRGFTQKEIAKLLGRCEHHVSRICRERRYLEAFDAKLDTIDDEFLRLKPDALRALADSLHSREETVRLRASEIWFKLTGQGGYGNGADDRARVTAEDIAQAIIAGHMKVTVTAEPVPQASPTTIDLNPTKKQVR
jgi:predicted transcriptional regulator